LLCDVHDRGARNRSQRSAGTGGSMVMTFPPGTGRDEPALSAGPPRRQASLRGLVQQPVTVGPEMPCADVYALFRRDTEASSVVVRLGATTWALVVKHRFVVTMSGHYGWALYHRKPISHLADTNPLILRPDTGLAQAAAAVLERDLENRYDDVIVQEPSGALLGTLPVGVLLAKLGRLHEEQAAEALHALERERRATIALRDSDAFRATILSTAPLVLFHVDLWGTVTMAEGSGLAVLGLRPSAITGRSIADVARRVPGLRNGYEKALGGGQVTFEARVGERWFDAVWSPLRNEVGVVTGAVCVATDITGRKRAETDLRDALRREHAGAEQLRAALEREHAAAEHLRQLDELKTTFLQAVSHDLRTPLASVLGIALTINQRLDALSESDRTDLLDRLVANARKLDRLVSDLLDLERLSRGRVELRWADVDLDQLVRELVEANAETLAGRRVEVDAVPARLVADRGKVERIVENLLVNAARHTKPGTPVWVSVRPAPPERGGAVLTVADGGNGVPAELRERIFEPFDRGPSPSNHAPGSGIGLALVARFAELHAGRAWVTDREGGGAAFHVHLGARPDRARAASAAPGAGRA
jgi:PAS domain S-box-containing protein